MLSNVPRGITEGLPKPGPCNLYALTFFCASHLTDHPLTVENVLRFPEPSWLSRVILALIVQSLFLEPLALASLALWSLGSTMLTLFSSTSMWMCLFLSISLSSWLFLSFEQTHCMHYDDGFMCLLDLTLTSSGTRLASYSFVSWTSYTVLHLIGPYKYLVSE